MDISHCLDGNADAVEFCPHDSFHHVLAASTYTLQDGERPSRSGSISLFNVDAEVGRLELLHRVDTAGIFDIKWNPVGASVGGPLLAQADADGYLRLHHLDSNLDGSQTTEPGNNILKEVGNEQVSSSMCLCLDWNPSSTSISVGLSDGSVAIVNLLDSQLETQELWKAHEFELWATSFDIHQPQLLYTGSDDCKFSCWDLRDGPAKLAFQNTKTHTMGVCCITQNPSEPHTLLTGSYDEYLRVWDVRAYSKPVSEVSVCLGGGVWRIKNHPVVPGLFLTACMHNGFAVVKIKDGKAEVVETYDKHGSLAYGADWQRGKVTTAAATCSFYDKLLRVWRPKREVFT